MVALAESLTERLSRGVRLIRLAEQNFDDDGITKLTQEKKEQRIASTTRGLHLNLKRVLKEGIPVDASVLKEAKNVHGEHIYHSIAFHDAFAEQQGNHIQFNW